VWVVRRQLEKKMDERRECSFFWGEGRYHASGVRWSAKDWAVFAVWARENGATTGRLEYSGVGYAIWYGPALICSNGNEEWWLNGVQFVPELK
jgi:hypothetical protein